MDNKPYPTINDPETAAIKSDHPSPDPPGIAGDPLSQVEEYFSARRIFDLSSSGQGFRDPFATTPRVEHTVSPNLSPKSPPEPGDTRTARKVLERVNKTFIDVDIPDEEPRTPDSICYGWVERSAPIIHEGLDDISSEIAIPLPSSQKTATYFSDTIEGGDETFRIAASSFFDPLDISYFVSPLRELAAHTLIDNDYHPEKAGFRVHDFFPHHPRSVCHCYWCELYSQTGGVREDHEMSMWCYCVACVADRARRMRELKRRRMEKRGVGVDVVESCGVL